MLNEREVRSLRDIERQLVAEDEQLESLMNGSLFERRERGVRCTYDAVVVVALAAALLCFLLAERGTAGAGALATAFAVVTAYLRWCRFPRRAT